MNLKRSLTTLLICMMMFLSMGCIGDENAEEGMGVIVSILPQKEMLDITVMVPLGSNPHDYEPLPSQLTAVSKAEMYFAVGSGVEFELQNLDLLSDQNSDMLVVNTSEGLELKAFDAHYHGNVSGAGAHLSGMIDPHVWTSPANLKVMAYNVLEALVQVDPDNEDEYRGNYDEYIDKVENVDQGIEEALSPIEGSAFLVYHPAWGYFGDEYSMVMLAIEEQEGTATIGEVLEIIENAKDLGIETIFISPQFDATIAQQIAGEIDGDMMIIDPMAEDLLDELLAVANEIAEGTAQ